MPAACSSTDRLSTRNASMTMSCVADANATMSAPTPTASGAGPEALTASGRKIALDEAAVDLRQRHEVGQRHVLVHLMGRGIAQAHLNDRAEVLDEARVRGAAGRRQRRLLPRDALDRCAHG